MASIAKPGADLLWAFQLHREHGALSKRLKVLENTTTQQQDRIAASEHNASSAQDERLEALAKQLQTLQESDVTEQVAGLANELRATRHQVDQARDKVKNIENAHKEADGRVQEREQTVQGRFGNMESTLAQVQRALLGFDGRLELAAQHGARVAAEGLQEIRQQHGDEVKGLSERLRSLQDAQIELRALVDGVTRDGHRAPGASTVLDQTDTVPSSTTAPSHNPTVPTAQHGKAKQAKPPGKAKKCFDKEIASLINGEGSLTNASILQSQLSPDLPKGGGKKRKAPADEGPILRSTLTQRETRSQVKKVIEEPLATRAKVLVKPPKEAAKAAGTNNGVTRQAPNTTTRVKKEPGKNVKRATLPVPEHPLPPSSFDQLQLEVSEEVVESPSPAPLPLPPRSKGKGKGKWKGKLDVKVEQRPQQQGRRRIKQDDSMEEFLAKCRAATGE